MPTPHTPEPRKSIAKSARRTRSATPAKRTLDEIAPGARGRQDSVAQYLDEIARYPRLTRDEERSLSNISLDPKSSDEDREEAQQHLVRSNLKLVVSICKDFTRNNFPLLELVSPGNEGLIVASRKYDGSRGVPFANYAAYWIKQRIMKYVAEHGFAVRMPPYRAAIVNQVVRVNAKLMQTLGRQPALDEVAEQVECSISEVEEVLRMLQPALELDAPLTEESDASTFGTYFGESVADAEARVDADLRAIDLQKALSAALATLPERDAQVLRWHFGIDGQRDLNLDQVAAKLGVTRERARQIKQKALTLLKGNTDLQEFLG